MRRFLATGLFILLDAVILIVISYCSLYLRFEQLTIDRYFMDVTAALPLLLVSYIGALAIFRVYNRMWQYAGSKDVFVVCGATFVGSVIYWGACVGFHHELPRSVYVLTFILATGALGLTRLIFHYFLSGYRYQLRRERKKSIPVLIVGAGDAGVMICKEIMSDIHKQRQVVGFVDDDSLKKNRIIQGYRVLGTRKDIAKLVKAYNIEEIIIAMPSAKAGQIREIVNICTPLKTQITILPGLYQILNNQVSVSQLRPVDIEDLLQRDEVILDTTAISEYLKDHRVLVTGAGGSIGSEICRQVMRMNPAQLVLLGHGENSIYQIHRELISAYPDRANDIIPVIADIVNREQLKEVFDTYKPQVVFHAAAHKHVPMMERQPKAAVINNIQGTFNVAEEAGEHGVERFVMISTDKAVNPTSVMGATKRVAEKIIQTIGQRYATKYMVVRFGNVLGSRGSVIPLFREQIKKGGPITVTHPEMVRYFMTIPEASRLVLQAGSMGKGGEVFLLDMGSPVKIVDLAKSLIRLSGFEPETEIPITYSGLRPGEKLYEELLTAGEGIVQTKHDKIFESAIEPVEIQWLYDNLNILFQQTEPEDVIKELEVLVPDYYPNHVPTVEGALLNRKKKENQQ